ncbi:MAG: hypothetical protein WBD02_06870 [Acidimicrobiia bacterium]
MKPPLKLAAFALLLAAAFGGGAAIGAAVSPIGEASTPPAQHHGHAVRDADHGHATHVLQPLQSDSGR